MNSNFKVIGLTRLAIKSELTAPEADTLVTRPFELFTSEIYVNASFCSLHNLCSTMEQCLQRFFPQMISICSSKKRVFVIAIKFSILGKGLIFSVSHHGPDPTGQTFKVKLKIEQPSHCSGDVSRRHRAMKS